MDESQAEKFIMTLREKISIEEQKANLRMTPRGLFVKDSYKEKIADLFNRWIESLSGEPIKRSNEKTRIKLFGADDSPKLCLMEGKDSFEGGLLECAAADIQRFKLPSFLGSLVSTRDHLHPGDPIFSSDGISYLQSASGATVQFKTANGIFSIPYAQIKNYRALLLTSYRVKKDYPDLETNLQVTLKVLKHLFSKARVVRRTEQLIVPQRFAANNRVNYWFIGHFIFVVEGNGLLGQAYFLKDESLYKFIKDEFAHLEEESRTKWFEDFNFAPKNVVEKNRYFGELAFPANRYGLTPHAFKQYIETVLNGNIEHNRYKGLFTIKHALRNFMGVFKLAKPIDYKLIKNLVPDKFSPKMDYRIAEGLVFVVSGEKDIEGCFSRYG